MQSGGTTLSPIRFKVTSRMVSDFARLSGDHSSLHTDSTFARHSLYRECVAHGMLPVMFLSRLPIPEPTEWRIASINATFTRPVYSQDELVITATVDETGDSQRAVEIEFEITRLDTVVTQGLLTLRHAPDKSRGRPGKSSDRETLLVQSVEESNVWFDQISTGEIAALEFKVEPGHVTSLVEMVSEDTKSSPSHLIDPCGFLGLSLFSTLVGMRQPGRQATFLNFEASFSESLKPNAKYRLEGKVAFKSASTTTISSAVTISSEGKPVVTGKTHARVNPPPAMMPSIQSLKETALESGLRDKVVLITGASRGLGQTTARLFALHGAKVALNYLNSRTAAEAVVEEIRAIGGQALAVKADVRQRSQVQRMVKKIVDQWGRVDVLVNNAVGDFQSIPFLELTWEQMDVDLSVIVQGAFHCCQAVLPHMIQQGGGKIVNLSTVAVENPPAGQAKYITAKSALVGLTRSLAVEFASKNIQVNLVVPGMVETDLTKHVPKVFVNKLKSDTPMNRLADPAEVAKAIVFLASAQSSFTTGQKLMVTGGSPPLF